MKWEKIALNHERNEFLIYTIFGKVILVKDDTILVMILQSKKFENGTLILVKSETIKIMNSSVNQALNS